MGILSNNIKNIVGDRPRSTAVGFKTGIDLLDYSNGKLVKTKAKNNYYSLGIDDGTYVLIVGASGSGKTTFAIQTAYNIVRGYEEGMIIHYDIENATDLTRVNKLTGASISELEGKYVLVKPKIYIEDIYASIIRLADQKREHYEEIKVETPYLDENDNKISIYPPTVVIIDSIAMMKPKPVKTENDEEMSGQMSATMAAKKNTDFIKSILQVLKETNIILIGVNHINEKVNTSFLPTPALINYLQQDETLPGGKAMFQFANNLFKLQCSTKLKEDEGYGFHGFKSKLTIIKSRSAPAGKTIELVYEPNTGFNNVLSNWEKFKALKLVGGGGRAYYLTNLPDVKVTQKTIIETYENNKEFRMAFKKLIKENYTDLIYTDDDEETPSEAKPKKAKKEKSASIDDVVID